MILKQHSTEVSGVNGGNSGGVREGGGNRLRGCCPHLMSISMKITFFYLFSVLNFHIKHPLKKNALPLDIYTVSKYLPKRCLLITKGKVVTLC